MNIDVYTRPGCAHCDNVKTLLNSKNIPYNAYVIEQDITLDDVKKNFPLASSLPIVVIDNIWIGGETQTRIWLSEHQL